MIFVDTAAHSYFVQDTQVESDTDRVLISDDIQRIKVQKEFCLEFRMLRLVGVLLLLWFDEYGAVSLPQTDTCGWTTIDEDTHPSILCTKIDASHHVTWSLVLPNNTVTDIGSCAPSETTCNSSDPNIELSRPRECESHMEIKSSHRALKRTSVTCQQGTSSTATSKLHVIRNGTISECKTTENTTAWMLSVTCSIEGAFSSEDRYTCTWSTLYTSTLTTVFHRDTPVAGQQYIGGQCILTLELPTIDGVHTYDLKFSPGPAIPQRVANVTIRSPAGPHTGPNCPESVAEGDTVTCDCVTTDYGNPASDIRWSGFTSHQLIVHRVTRDMDGTVYNCTQTWNLRVVGNVFYTLHVTYVNTRISGPFPFVTDGTEILTLTCNTTNVSFESLMYKWTGFVCDNGNQGNTCTFTPRVPEDDGKIATCTPTSSKANVIIAAANFSLAVYYPPSQPVITGHNTSHVLTVGDSVSLTCTVSGGKPPITNISFYCIKNYQKRYIGVFDPLSSSSTVKIDRLNASDNGAGCVCIGKWHPDSTRHFVGALGLIVADIDQPSSIDQSSSNVGAAVGGGVASAVVVAAVIFGISIYRKFFGNDRLQPRQEQPNYTDLALYEDVGNSQQQTVNDITDPESASPYVNQGADVDIEGAERDVVYVNTGPGEFSRAAPYDRLEPSSQESSNYTGLILNNDAAQNQARNEHDYQNTSFPSTGTSAAERN